MAHLLGNTDISALVGSAWNLATTRIVITYFLVATARPLDGCFRPRIGVGNVRLPITMGPRPTSNRRRSGQRWVLTQALSFPGISNDPRASYVGGQVTDFFAC